MPAISFLGDQLKIATDSNHGRARIKSIECNRIEKELAGGSVIVVAGYQGVDPSGDITTLGRGASDLTAVALAAALKADACEIYTDVDGVYTADPNICPGAQKLKRISYDEMLEMSALGAKVLQGRSVELARRYNVPLVVAFELQRGLGRHLGRTRGSIDGRRARLRRDARPEPEQDHDRRGGRSARACGARFSARSRRPESSSI